MFEFRKLGTNCLLGLVLLTACTSQRFEPQVQGVDGAESRLQLRADIASNLNDRIDQVSLAVDQLTNATNQLLALFPELKSHVNANSLKTLALSLSSLKNGLGTDENDRFLRTGRVQLDFLSPADPCRQVDLLVDGKIQDAILGEEVKIMARTCGADNYAPFISLRSNGARGQKFSLNMAPFEALIGSSIAQVQIPPECEVEISDSFSLDYLKCSGVRIFENNDFELTLGSFLVDRRPKSDPITLSIEIRLTPRQRDAKCQIFKGWLGANNNLQHSQAFASCDERRD